MAASQNFTIEQGAYWSQELLYKQSNETPVDLTGFTARMQIRKKVTSGSPLISLDSDPSGGITLGGNAGTILLEISAEDTAALPATPSDHKWVYDLELVPSDDHVIRLIQGHITVSLEVTRPVV